MRYEFRLFSRILPLTLWNSHEKFRVRIFGNMFLNWSNSITLLSTRQIMIVEMRNFLWLITTTTNMPNSAVELLIILHEKAVTLDLKSSHCRGSRSRVIKMTIEWISPIPFILYQNQTTWLELSCEKRMDWKLWISYWTSPVSRSVAPTTWQLKI